MDSLPNVKNFGVDFDDQICQFTAFQKKHGAKNVSPVSCPAAFFRELF